MYIYHLPNCPKMLRETLGAAQAALSRPSAFNERTNEHILRIQDLINECERMRPTGPDGKHGDRHTTQCGCDDMKPEDDLRYLWKVEKDQDWFDLEDLYCRMRDRDAARYGPIRQLMLREYENRWNNRREFEREITDPARQIKRKEPNE